jgi:Lon protease-like protein
MGIRPMFPLESVLVPGMVLPLHVFEPRYRALVRACLDGDGEFGVVLIERGSEVGGGDVRSDVGTLARIVQAEELEDGRWAVVAVGEERVRILRWLDDDPYPRGDVEPWPDEVPEPDSDAAAELEATYRERVVLLRRVLAMAAELGQPTSATVDIVDEPVLGSHHLTVLAPIGPLDRQRLLCEPGPSARLELLGALLEEEAAVLEAQLSEG